MHSGRIGKEGECTLDRIAAIIDKYVSVALALALLFMFVLIFLNVVLRFVFSTGVSMAEELARFAFLWTTFLGAWLAIRENQHIGITGLRGMIDERFHWIVALVINGIKVAVLAIVIVGAWRVLMSNLGGRAPVSGAPVAIGFAAVVVGVAFLLTTFVYRFCTLVTKWGRRGT